MTVYNYHFQHLGMCDHDLLPGFFDRSYLNSEWASHGSEILFAFGNHII